MTQEEKQLLFIDLCARLPYNFVYCYCNAPLANGKPIILTPVVISNLMNATEDLVIKPYLRPMSSMTAEEVKEIQKINWQFCKPKNDLDECFVGDADDGYCSISQMASILNYLNEHHFDYRGFIPMGLALEAIEGMYKFE